MKKKNKHIDSIAELLPEGLTETTVEEIAKLVDQVITEQVEDKIDKLSNKVNSYLRFQIDQLKEQALKELELENETYRNAVRFEDIKSLMAFEITDKDKDNAITKVVEENNEIQNDLEFLAEKLNEALEMNEDLENTVKLLTKKNKKLVKEAESLVESVSNLELRAEQDFSSSEKAVMISEVDDSVSLEDLKNKSKNKEERTFNNEFLTEEMVKLI